MASATSLALIPIKDKETILTIKNLGKPSHINAYIVEDFIKDYCFHVETLPHVEWYVDIFDYVKNGNISPNLIKNERIRLKK